MNHIVKSYDRDLEEVLGEVTAMGRLVREQLVKAADALEKLDADEARSVMTRDAEVNGYEVSVDAKIESVFARRQPAARDLRTLIGMSRVSVDFERMGDEIRNMAGSVLELKGLDDSLLENRSAIIMAVNTVANMIDDSILALSRLDTNLAREVIARDRLVDDVYRTMVQKMPELMHEHQKTKYENRRYDCKNHFITLLLFPQKPARIFTRPGILLK